MSPAAWFLETMVITLQPMHRITPVHSYKDNAQHKKSCRSSGAPRSCSRPYLFRRESRQHPDDWYIFEEIRVVKAFFNESFDDILSTRAYYVKDSLHTFCDLAVYSNLFRREYVVKHFTIVKPHKSNSNKLLWEPWWNDFLQWRIRVWFPCVYVTSAYGTIANESQLSMSILLKLEPSICTWIVKLDLKMGAFELLIKRTSVLGLWMTRSATIGFAARIVYRKQVLQNATLKSFPTSLVLQFKELLLRIRG